MVGLIMVDASGCLPIGEAVLFFFAARGDLLSDFGSDARLAVGFSASGCVVVSCEVVDSGTLGAEELDAVRAGLRLGGTRSWDCSRVGLVAVEGPGVASSISSDSWTILIPMGCEDAGWRPALPNSASFLRRPAAWAHDRRVVSEERRASSWSA
jgi:hypothetical protein